MNMNKWNPLVRARKTITVLALAFAVSLGGYEFLKPANASAASVAAASAAAMQRQRQPWTTTA